MSLPLFYLAPPASSPCLLASYTYLDSSSFSSLFPPIPSA